MPYVLCALRVVLLLLLLHTYIYSNKPDFRNSHLSRRPLCRDGRDGSGGGGEKT